MNETQRGYISYLLRLWQAEDNGELVWWASLESSQTGQRWVFANLDEALVFLRVQTSELSVNQEGSDNLSIKEECEGEK
ncbi:MAG: hypothetical protein H6667_14335 [Ardenticatenaceae bacterium]|nr:hypothetical protein [Ardenticatenaceae bacterium]MCB9444233.1 hypothetical protein [Ardenticatenaceae bacterium]